MVTESETALLADPEAGPESLADRVLLDRFVLAGDRGAMDEVLGRHWPTAIRVARRYTGNDADAEDCVQEALLRVCRVAGQFGGRGSVRAWLLQAVVNACRMRFREEDARQRRQRGGGETEILRRQRTEPDPEHEELRDQVRAAVADLPERYRLPLWLRYVEDLSLQEVAQALHRPEATVRSQIHRGLKQVGDRLGRAGLALSLPLLGGWVGQLSAAELVPPLPTALCAAALPMPQLGPPTAVTASLSAAQVAAVGLGLLLAALATGTALAFAERPGSGRTAEELPQAAATPAPASPAAAPPAPVSHQALALFEAQRQPEALRRYAATLTTEAGRGTGHAHRPQPVQLVPLDGADPPRLGIILDARWQPGATETLVITQGFPEEAILSLDCRLRLPDFAVPGPRPAELPLQLTALLRTQRPDPAPRRILETHPEVLRRSGLLEGAWVAYRAEVEHCQDDGVPATELRYYLEDELYLRSRIELRSAYLLPVSITDHLLEVAELRVRRGQRRLDPL
jgi:RNA polymerase sigma-70 factor (ECF subfamily)